MLGQIALRGVAASWLPCVIAIIPNHKPFRLQLSWCDPEDIGSVAAAVIAGGPERWADAAVGVAGEHASLEEVAGTLSRMFGKQVRRRVYGSVEGTHWGGGTVARTAAALHSAEALDARSTALHGALACCSGALRSTAQRRRTLAALPAYHLPAQYLPRSCPQVVAVTPPADEWAQAVMGFGVPEGVARDLANM